MVTINDSIVTKSTKPMFSHFNLQNGNKMKLKNDFFNTLNRKSKLNTKSTLFFNTLK